MRIRTIKTVTVLLLGLSTLVPEAAADVLPVMHRRPAAAVLSADETMLYVANQRSGTLSTIDLQSGTVAERSIGQQLAALVRRPQSQEIIAVDVAGAELIVLRESQDGTGLSIRRRFETALWPVDVAIDASGTRCCAASLWSRRATVFSLTPEVGVASTEASAAPGTVINLPFAAGAVEFLDDRHAVLADAFGGRLAVVDCAAGELCSARELPVHNIRCLTRDGKQLLLTHQTLNSAARTEAEHIHWGILMQNEVSVLPIDALLDPQADLDAARHVVSVGAPGRGAGDPQAIVGLSDRLLLTLGGTDELALIDRVGVREVRVATGARPVDVVINRDASLAFAANALADSVSVVDLQRNKLVNEFVLGPTPEPGPVERGERAFFSSRLSLEDWMSCHSCHTDGHTNNQLADTLGDGGYGEAKRVPSLLGVWATGPWAWNGKHAVLKSQIEASLQTTMHTRDYRVSAGDDDDTPTREDVAADLAAYLTTLSRPPSVTAARLAESSPGSGFNGADVFESRGCSTCHDPFTSLTTDDVFDVGLPDRSGLRLFNPPSLGGVSQRDRLLHDGRARSLQEVLLKFRHPTGQQLPRAEAEALIEYLNGL